MFYQSVAADGEGLGLGGVCWVELLEGPAGVVDAEALDCDAGAGDGLDDQGALEGEGLGGGRGGRGGISTEPYRAGVWCGVCGRENGA